MSGVGPCSKSRTAARTAAHTALSPRPRGSSRSRPLPNIIEETDRLLAGGFGEIVISGINLAQYGRDEASPQIADMWDLLRLFNTRYADKYLGKARFRLSSLYPAQLTGKMKDKALRTLSEVPLVCPHLHLSLQSLSPEVLLRMGRKSYDMAGIHIFLKELASIWPAYGLGADFICGFPGETNYEFQQTLEYTELLPLSYAHVFPVFCTSWNPCCKNGQPRIANGKNKQSQTVAGYCH